MKGGENMQVEIGRIHHKTGEFELKTIAGGYEGALEVKDYTNGINGRPDPLIKRKDGNSFCASLDNA